MKTSSLLNWLCQILFVVSVSAAPAESPTPLLCQSEAELLRVLAGTSDPKSVVDACRQLAIVGSSNAVPTLARLLNDPQLAGYALIALENIPEPGPNAALRSALLSLKGKQLAGVITSLGVRQDVLALPLLGPLLGDPDFTVAQAAARAMGGVVTPQSTELLQRALTTSPATLQPVVADSLLRHAESLIAMKRTKAALALYHFVLDHGELPLRTRASATRGQILALRSKVAPALKLALMAPDYEIFAAGISALLETKSATLTRTLVTCLPQLDADRQTVAFRALGQIADSAAVAALTAQVTRGETPLRLVAITAAVATGDASVCKSLLGLLADPNRETVLAAQDGLAALPGRATDRAVIKLMTDVSPSMRVIGIELAGRRRMVAAVPVLFRAAADPAPTVRASAIKRLGELGRPADLPALLNLLLRNSDAKELELISESLGDICTRAPIPTAFNPTLGAAFPRASQSQQVALLEALGIVGGADALAVASAALADADPAIHTAALSVLAEWPDATAAPVLLRHIPQARNPEERAEAFRGLIKLTRESNLSPGDKLNLLTQAEAVAAKPSDQKLLLAALGDIASPAALRKVANYLERPELAEEASASAVRIAAKLDAARAKETVPVLELVLRVAKSESTINKARQCLDQLASETKTK
jgi:HEAT repeat protein